MKNKFLALILATSVSVASFADDWWRDDARRNGETYKERSDGLVDHYDRNGGYLGSSEYGYLNDSGFGITVYGKDGEPHGGRVFDTESGTIYDVDKNGNFISSKRMQKRASK